jgi:hypothetical protein
LMSEDLVKGEIPMGFYHIWFFVGLVSSTCCKCSKFISRLFLVKTG